MYRPEVGDTVTYNGWSKEQVVGETTTLHICLSLVTNILSLELSGTRSHTKVCIKGVGESMKFNSVHFTLAEGSVTL